MPIIKPLLKKHIDFLICHKILVRKTSNEEVQYMAKKSSKKGAKQKNKQGFDSAVLNEEFSHEMGSADSNQKAKDKAKKKKAGKNNGAY
jgi:hypothetical protein